MVFLTASLLLAFLYFVLQAYYLFHWHRTTPIVIPSNFQPATPLSVIVVARNEEEHIAETIHSILRQQYPKDLFELIIIDDRSEDNTADIARGFQSGQVRVLRLADFPSFVHPPAFKKSGIELGVHVAKFQFIVMTDADCVHHGEWLKTIAYISEQKGTVFMTGPTLINHADTPVEKMQQLEFMGLVLVSAAGIQGGAHIIANGANMSFSKQAFMDVKGYVGNYNYASGDDMFLAEKMKQYLPDKIYFIKSTSAVVFTAAKPDWDALIKQRIRWAGKNKGLKDQTLSNVWLFIGAYHVVMVLLLLISFVNIFAILAFSIMLFTKLIMDFMAIKAVSGFFRTPINVFDFIRLQVVYAYYIITLGFHMMTGKKGDWK